MYKRILISAVMPMPDATLARIKQILKAVTGLDADVGDPPGRWNRVRM